MALCQTGSTRRVLMLFCLLLYCKGALDGTFPFASLVDPTPCSSFCMYKVNTARNLVGMCAGSSPGVNGGCTDCDELLFRKVPPAGGVYDCVDHRYNGQFLQSFTPLSNFLLGYYWNTVAFWRNSQIWSAALPNPHHSVRIRFGTYFYQYSQTINYYPLSYSMDDVEYKYDQTLLNYWSSYDIVTSPKQTHSLPMIVVNWRSINDSYPINTGSCGYGTCYCICSLYNYCSGWWEGCCSSCSYGCWPGSSCTAVWNCCEERYIMIRDVLLFSSRCQTGCLSCSSSTYCKICDITLGYWLYPLDHMCYLICPQATYPNGTATWFQNNAAHAINQNWCLDCNATCLECDNLTYCTRCYTLGRNQSFLFNNTCVNPCYNGYVANYTNHTCYCPLDYHYQIVDPLILLCIPCAHQCIRCFGPTNLECTVCQRGFYLANNTFHCLNQCPAGQFQNLKTDTCYNCDSSCTSCEHDSTLCTQCFFNNPTKYLLGQQCLTWCPPGYSWNNITHKCEVCPARTYSFQGSCHKNCPSLYVADPHNSSCIHLSLTEFTYNITLNRVNVLNHGKLLKFSVYFGNGLSNSSLQLIKTQSYFKVLIRYFDSKMQKFIGVRKLQEISLPIRNVQIDGNSIFFYTNLPEDISYLKAFQIIFLQTISGSNQIDYANVTNTYDVNQNPQIIKEYYSYTVRNYYNLIILPFILLLVLLILVRIKGMGQLLLEIFRVAQLLGVLVYSAFPVGQYIFFFLIGCSYANLDFIPNIYATYAQPESQSALNSYLLVSDDMDFIRLNGSVIVFAIIWLVVIVIAKFLIKCTEDTVEFYEDLGFQLCEVKVLHSFWSSLLWIVVNYDSSSFAIFASFGFAWCGMAVIVARRWSTWKVERYISPFFISRAAVTFIICWMSMGNEIVVSIVFVVGFLTMFYEYQILHSNRFSISILQLNSSNYMDERSFKVLNDQDKHIPFSFSISTRNISLSVLPLLTSLLFATAILLRDFEKQVVISLACSLYFLLALAIFLSAFISLFLQKRRKELVQQKLEVLQKRYNSLCNMDTQVLEDSKTKASAVYNFDKQQYDVGNRKTSMKH